VLEKLKQSKIGLSTIPASEIFSQISPTKLMEYLAAGCCVVATKGIKDQEEIMRSAFGEEILIDFEPAQVAEAIHEILADQNKAVEMTKRGRNFIFEKRSYNEMAKRLRADMDFLIKK
jgi:glycosyltransferase involved in cell wall biosynthesis